MLISKSRLCLPSKMKFETKKAFTSNLKTIFIKNLRKTMTLKKSWEIETRSFEILRPSYNSCKDLKMLKKILSKLSLSTWKTKICRFLSRILEEETFNLEQRESMLRWWMDILLFELEVDTCKLMSSCITTENKKSKKSGNQLKKKDERSRILNDDK